MRIDELTPYRNTEIYKKTKDVRDDNVRDIFRTLNSLGYVSYDELMGSGIFAAVFKRKNDPYVIKLFQNDPGYLKYLEYARDHQDNPHIPKIRGKIMKPYKDVELYLVRMEELLPLRDDIRDQFFGLYSDVSTYVYSKDKHAVAKRATFKDDHPQLAALLDDIKRMGRTVDLHDDNVMVRQSDKKLVITDPLI